MPWSLGRNLEANAECQGSDNLHENLTSSDIKCLNDVKYSKI